eukprot:GFUD01001932.1.p1 GENE.GFUD01001932.1~~GFUD01001932.1.p1  ORF type:complete len:254 (-),score=53.80 GFUD01001932.1:5-766(-)
MTAEKFNLTWNDFVKSTSDAFKELLVQQEFVDVTLISEDDKEIKCHKVVLSACSPILKNILLRNPHQHPLIYLSGVQYLELKSLVSFMYLGQTEVFQDDLNGFMDAASKFQIKGLSNEEERKETSQETATKINSKEETEYKPIMHGDDQTGLLNQQQNISHSWPIENMNETSDYLETLPDHREDTNWMSNSYNLDKIGSEFTCEKCEYKSKKSADVRKHMNAQHEGIKFDCDMCGYQTGYSHNLKKHKRNKHM